ncbi:hypothetical protein [Azospirillum brasilense]|nr:hypothetical protein [Azospirillum brasilense]
MDLFIEHPVLGDLSEEQINDYLRDINAADEIRHRLGASYGAAGQALGFLDFGAQIWRCTNHHFGFIDHQRQQNERLQIIPANTMAPDSSLRNARIKVTLDKLRVAKYPGGGEHTILFDFFGRNQVDKETEDLHYNSTYRVRDGDSAGINGYPIFVNLTVGNDGVAFRCSTVNVQSDLDERLASVFDSDVFRQGLTLTTNAQPALRPFVEMANGVVKNILARNKSRRVQDFSLGLDFAPSATAAKLREGSYVVVQAPEDRWSWSQWSYDQQSARVARSETKPGDVDTPIYNYIIFSIARMS